MNLTDLNKNCLSHISSFLIARDVRELECSSIYLYKNITEEYKKELQARYYESRACICLMKQTCSGKGEFDEESLSDMSAKSWLQKCRKEIKHCFVLEMLRVLPHDTLLKFSRKRYCNDMFLCLSWYGVAVLYYKHYKHEDSDDNNLKKTFKDIRLSAMSRYFQEFDEWRDFKEMRKEYQQEHATLMCGDLDISRLDIPETDHCQPENIEYQVFIMGTGKEVQWYNMEKSGDYLQGQLQNEILLDEDIIRSWVVVHKSLINTDLSYFVTKPFVGSDDHSHLLWIRTTCVRRVQEHEYSRSSHVKSWFYGKLDYEPVSDLGTDKVHHVRSNWTFPLHVAVTPKGSFQVFGKLDSRTNIARVNEYKDLWYDEKHKIYRGKNPDEEHLFFITIERVADCIPEMMRYFLKVSKNKIKYELNIIGRHL